MAIDLKSLSKYTEDDEEKMELVDDVLDEQIVLFEDKIDACLSDFDLAFESKKKIKKHVSTDYSLHAPEIFKPIKFCPQCGKKFSLKTEVFCPECLVHLKPIKKNVKVIDITSKFKFRFSGDVTFESFEDLLVEDNLQIINEFNFTMDDFTQILTNVKKQAFDYFNMLLTMNNIDFDDLEITDKVILFAKAFTDVKYKSDGWDLGYFKDNTIYIDDRQTKALQITTIFHELSHFILNEVLTHILCKLLNSNKNQYIETLISYVLSYSEFCELIDEYAAHNVEGRFTIFGYQDYSSFKNIEMKLKDIMDESEIEVTKSAGNTFAGHIKEIIEAMFDEDLREEIKDRFKEDIMIPPNYNELMMENCQKLSDEGFLSIILIILNQGFQMGMSDIETLEKLNKEV